MQYLAGLDSGVIDTLENFGKSIGGQAMPWYQTPLGVAGLTIGGGMLGWLIWGLLGSWIGAAAALGLSVFVLS
jgi:hypothetical protein